ncbi:hypothetical protein Tco_1008599, partial [Tanacetum coccineum]
VTQKANGIFISQDKYVDEILKKFCFSTMKTATSRPDIMFVVCACARFQVTPKVSHLHAMKKIFRYLKGQPKLGLWYPKDSPFDLEAYTDSDYVGASLDRKSTTGGCQFLGSRLISWQRKKQTIVTNSTTKAEYVAASSCCGQVLWIQNQMLDYGYNFMNTKIFIDNESTVCIVKNPVFHSKTKHIEISHHFIRDSNKKKLIQMIKIHTNQNVADLLTKAFDVSRFQYLIPTLLLFWQTATASTLDNGEMEITATIDGKVKIVTEASQGPIIQGEGSTYPVESPTQTNVTDEATSIGVDVRHGGAATTVTSLDAGQGSGNIDKTPTMPHDSPLLRVHTLGSDEDRMKHNELMDFVTKLSDRVVALETDLTQTKKVYGASFTKLIKKVKRLEKKDKLSKSRRKLRLVLSDEEGSDSDILAQEDPSKQGRKIAQIEEDEGLLCYNCYDSVDDIATESLVYIRRSAAKTKDKGKGIMEESESDMTKTKRQQEQERLGLEIVMRLQEEFDEEERQRIAIVHEPARSFFVVEWEDIRARVEASEELVQRLQTEEREKYSEDDQAKMLVDLINQRKRYFATQKAKEKKNKPMTQAQQRTYLSNYIKHMGNYKLQQLKRLSFDEIKDLFESTMRRANTFVPMETKIRRGVPKLVADSS